MSDRNVYEGGQGDAVSSKGKDLKRRLPQTQNATEYLERRRTWYCRTCGHEEFRAAVPTGWYLLSRQLSDPRPGHTNDKLRLGIYCSVMCLAKQLPRIMNAEEDYGENWEERAGNQGQFRP